MKEGGIYKIKKKILEIYSMIKIYLLKIQLDNNYSNKTARQKLIQIESDETFVNKFTVKAQNSGISF